MTTHRTKQTTLIVTTIIIAMMLTIYPLPDMINDLRPDWVPLIVIYWVMNVPYRFSVGYSWLIGFLLDALLGTLLGEHALALAVIAYITVKTHLQLRLYPAWQQAIVICLLLLLYKFLIYWPQGILYHTPMNVKFWCSPIVSALLWLWIYHLLNGLRRGFNIY